MDASNAKTTALYKIEHLEKEIADLEKEKKLGRKEIDVIDAEIRLKRSEITQLRRKYLNYFYFF